MTQVDIDQLLGELTVAEKADLVSGTGFWFTTPVGRLGIPKIMVSDGPHGMRAQSHEGGDHLGIGGSIPATCFPTASAIASAWNPDLLFRIGEALAQEAKASRVSVILGPGINIKRSPLCGRNFEYFSEDPYLAGELAVGIVDGIQSHGIGTSVKHYAANNQETDRLRVDSQVDERTLREIYLPAFERVIKASQPWTVMCSYNKINGTSASENKWLLTTVLRDEFGFDGLVISDWGAVYHPVKAVQARMDLEMPSTAGISEAQIVAAVESGELEVAELDACVRKVLELVDKGKYVLDLDETFDPAAHHALARQAAAESIVLLKNDGGLLPLAGDRSVAVIGEFARSPRYQGAGSSQVNPTRLDNFLDELRAGRGDVSFAAGYGIGDTTNDEPLAAEAVELAASSDVAVVVLALPADGESEGYDRTHMNLPANQLAVLSAVAEVNANVVVVLANGSTLLLGDVLPHAKAVLEAWLGGQAAGGAIVDVLTGKVNPSGRLAESIPHRVEDNSSYLNFPGSELVVRYGEGIFVGYRAYDKTNSEVAFPFGFGLSYTSFELSELTVSTTGSVAEDTLSATVTVSVTNTGEIAGAEVVQVYVGDPEASVERPLRELKGFAKVFLEPGATQQVSIALDQRAFAFWSQRHNRWAVEAGEFTIEVGQHSRDLPLQKTIHVDAPRLAQPLTRESSLEEWLADPAGQALVEREIAAGAIGIAAQPSMLPLIGNFPMATLANMRLCLDNAILDRVTAEWAAQQ